VNTGDVGRVIMCNNSGDVANHMLSAPVGCSFIKYLLKIAVVGHSI